MMYGLPPNVDVSFLIDASLTQVCIGENEVILNLEPDISIMVASKMLLLRGDEQLLLDDPRAAAAPLSSLIPESIVVAEGSTDGTLRLIWSEGAVLEIQDSWSEYESYTVTAGNKIIVV